jgi:hypothetical protein
VAEVEAHLNGDGDDAVLDRAGLVAAVAALRARVESLRSD